MYIWDTVPMRASRLLSILMLLQARGRLSAQSLARELEVSVRTVHRDIDQLSAAGVPVWADRGRTGGFQLQEGWRTALTGLTEHEARALFLSGLSGAAAELGLGQAVASARLKVLATLPAQWQDEARHVNSRFHLDAVDWFRSAAHTQHLSAVADAVWRERRLGVRYDSWRGTRERVIEPLGLVLKAGVWYLAARTANAPSPRVYRVSNISELKVLEQRFKPPANFDLAAYWQESTRRFETDIYKSMATLRASARGMRLLRSISSVVAEAVDKTAAKEKTGDWSRVIVPIESVEHAADQLISYGADVEALKPKPLRDRLRTTAQRLAKLYGRPVDRT
jgi:predicted DNA-binding transcriptional regulator YafY